MRNTLTAIVAVCLLTATAHAGGGTGDNPTPVKGGGHAPIIEPGYFTEGGTWVSTPQRELVMDDYSAPAGGHRVVSTDNGAKGGTIVTKWSNQMGDHEIVTKRVPSDKPGEAAKRHAKELREMIGLVGGKDGTVPTGG